MAGWTYADLWEAVAEAIPARPAQVHGARTLSWRDFDRRADALARHLLDAGLQHQSKVAAYLYNGPEYLETYYAAFKAGLAPVNTNYRYVADELVYLFDNADAEAVVFHASFAPTVDRIRGQLPKVRSWIAVAEAGHPVPPFAADYDALVAQDTRRTQARWGRSGDDVLILYTGGTTGMPKGVMWRNEDLFMAFGGGNPYGDPRGTPGEVIEFAKGCEPLVMMAAAPLMHGAAQMATFIAWWMGGTMVYTRRFDAAEVLRAIEREKVVTINITGDAMARPLADEIASGSYDLGSLRAISSTGAILSGAVRDRLRELLPEAMILDNFGSSESGYTASGVEGSSPESGLRYRPNNARLRVLDDSLRPVEPGSGVIGQVAKTGHIAFGYWRDPKKTAETFVEVDGARWLLTGDIATVEADGTITIFGRGSQCVNTGGEKVFPEEVEAVLKGHPGVFDAVVTGIPDERFGSRVAAVVQPYGATPAVEDLDAHCRGLLSGYKVPRTYAFVAEMERSPAGKADYRWARKVAEEAAAGS